MADQGRRIIRLLSKLGGGGVSGGLKGAATTGTAEGALVGAIVGAGASASAGVVEGAIESTLSDIIDRQLSVNEKHRVKLATTAILDRVYQRLIEGEKPRADGFFDSSQRQGGDRSPAEELFEGSLLKCKNEFQEKKIPFMANIFAEVAFRDDVSTALAHQVYVIADRMTYRQLLIVATVHRKEEIAFDTTKWNTSFTMCFIPGRSRAHVMTDELAGFMRELYALSRTGEDLLSYDRTSTVHHGSEQGVLTMLGRLVYELMRLDQIDVAELVSLKDEFVRITGIP